jgi:peptidoglycan/LPS O-acetylase OafA/YrhL
MAIFHPQAIILRPATAAGHQKFVPALDGLRALAILAVMAVHAGVPGASLGWLAVDLFFVLSGFLITTLLADEYARENTIGLGKFWGRRFLRLMPVYWLYVCALTIAMVVFHWGWLHNHKGWTVGGYVTSLWLYFANYAPLGGIWEHQSLAVHLWSLAVEEQFYFAWPVLCLIALRLGCATWVAWGLVAAIVCRRMSGMESFALLDTRGLGLVLGCAAALSLRDGRSPGLRRCLGMAPFRIFTLTSIALVVGVATYYRQRGMSEATIHLWVAPICVALFAALIAMLWYGPVDPIAQALAWRPLAYLGRISYGMYIYHMVSQYLTWNVLLRSIEYWPRWPKFGIRLLVYFAATVGLATLSYYFFEKQFLRLKALLR